MSGLKRMLAGDGMFWLGYAATCALLHHLLSYHYQDVCRPAWWSIGPDPTTYCLLVHRALSVLRAAPLVAAAPLLHRP